MCCCVSFTIIFQREIMLSDSIYPSFILKQGTPSEALVLTTGKKLMDQDLWMFKISIEQQIPLKEEESQPSVKDTFSLNMVGVFKDMSSTLMPMSFRLRSESLLRVVSNSYRVLLTRGGVPRVNPH